MTTTAHKLQIEITVENFLNRFVTRAEWTLETTPGGTFFADAEEPDGLGHWHIRANEYATELRLTVSRCSYHGHWSYRGHPSYSQTIEVRHLSEFGPAAKFLRAAARRYAKLGEKTFFENMDAQRERGFS